jgi:hypothetical protein
MIRSTGILPVKYTAKMAVPPAYSSLILQPLPLILDPSSIPLPSPSIPEYPNQKTFRALSKKLIMSIKYADTGRSLILRAGKAEVLSDVSA